MPLIELLKFPYSDFLHKVWTAVIFWLVIIVMTPGMYAQCVSTEAADIPDDGELTIDFFVSGLTDSDLASPTQGICRVEIDFRHEYLGDLNVSLVSPSGTTINLVAPITTATSSTSLSRWNIGFLPCMSTVTPDAGFANVFSNLQGWASLSTYTGTYHPNSGCLEDFNTGSANGAWKIIFRDGGEFQTGAVFRVAIYFCNPAGLQCMECNPNGGTINPSSITTCEGQSIQSSDVSVDFMGNQPDPLLYSYTYLLSSGNTIISSGPSFSYTPAPGIYTICGLSYLNADAAAVNTLVAGADNVQLIQAIANGTICASRSADCTTFNVMSIPDTAVFDVFLCKGESFSFKNQTYDVSGTFYSYADGIGLCDSVYQINIIQSQLTLGIALPDTLACGVNSIILSSQVGGNAGNVIYEWTTQTGNIIGASNTPNITVNQPGHYILNVTDDNCSESMTVTVVSGNGFPQIFLEGGELNCTVSSVDLVPVYVPSNGTILWTGPSGFTSTQPAINVVIPGLYFFTVTNEAGCSATKSVEVLANTITHAVDIELISKDCMAGIATLGISNFQDIVALLWSGPNNFFANTIQTNVPESGIYTLEATFSNGCTRASSYFFDGDFVLPDITAPVTDTLNCNETISASVISTTPGATYSWTGPASYTSNQSTISITQEGIYTARVIAPNGCAIESELEIVKGDDIFDFETFADTLDCNTDTVSIGVISDEADLFQWINYPGADLLQKSIEVSSTQIFTVVMTDTNTGCVITTNIVANSDYAYPSFGFTVDTINCINEVSELAFVPVAGINYDAIHWQFPDQSMVEANSIFSDQPGEHELFVIGSNGCQGTYKLEIPFDTLPPIFFVEADVLDCDLNVNINTLAIDAITTIQWTGPGMFNSTEFNPAVIDSGYYNATVVGLNGCTNTAELYIEGDFDAPLSLLTLEELTCNKPDVTFAAQSPDEIIRYEWKDGAGNTIGNNPMIQLTLPGTYTLELEGPNHCVSIDTIYLEPASYPDISVYTDTFKCEIQNVTLIADSDAIDPVYVWYDMQGDTLARINTLDADNPGPFIISITGANGCETIDTIAVPVDSLTPIIQLDVIGEVRCQNREFILDASSSTPSTIQYTWSTAGGMILSDNSLSIITAVDTGLYILEIYNPVNDCYDRDSVIIQEHPDAIKLALLDIKRTECSGDSNATITITGLQGGVSPILYQLDNMPTQINPVFDDLSAGSYMLQIEDAAGCQYDTLITIDTTEFFIVDAGSDQEIYIGEVADLTGVTDILPGEIFSQDWDSMGVLLCQDCLEPIVRPFETTVFTLRIESITGCIIEDEVTIYVIEKGKFYLPNVFSPNGDNANDEIRLHSGSGISKVLRWIIFDRWGNAVYGKTDFQPDDTSVFWDGTAQGSETLNPGVFPYVLEIELLNGNREVHHGTITLIK